MEETIKGKHEMEETNTIKGKEVIAYKGMNSDMTCKGFLYEIGKSYKTDKAKLCECGFHACLNPRDVLKYYSDKSKLCYFKVLLSGEITKCGVWDTNVAATEITILEEISIKGLLNIAEWWKHENVLNLLYFSDGFARVQRGDGLWNLIDKNGKLLFAEWFNYVDNFYDGLARVQRKEDKQYNFIGKQGKFLSNEWFIDAYYLDYGLGIVQKANGEWYNIDKTGTLIKFKDMEEKIKQVEDIDTLKELNKNLISENERLAKKNMKLSEKYQSTNKKNASLRTAIASIKGFENAEQLCTELNRLKQQNKSLSEANAKLIADAKVYLKTIDEQKKVISASEKSIGAINDKLKIITLSQQSMHQALKDSGEEKSELVKKYKEALSAKSVALSKQLELQEENIQLKEANAQLKENIINVYHKASLIQRIKYVFTKSI